MILLDTNVVSELMRREPASSVIRWLDAQPATSMWIHFDDLSTSVINPWQT